MNTFHFVSVGITVGDAIDSALDQVEAFYLTAPPGLSASLGAQFGVTVQRNFELRAYNLEDPPVRVPTIRPLTLPAALDTSPNTMPYEVCCVLSYRAAPPLTRRRRGRIYIPGVTGAWMTGGTSTTAPQFQTGTGVETDVIAKAAARLAAGDARSQWAIRSMATGTAVYADITDGYVDLEPDIQRRRGNREAVRIPWT